MSQGGFEIGTQADTRTLWVSGAMTFATADRLYPQVIEALRHEQVERLDLARAAPVDSAGLACVLAWLSAARRQGRSLAVVGAPVELRSLAQVSGTLGWVAPEDGGDVSAPAAAGR